MARFGRGFIGRQDVGSGPGSFLVGPVAATLSKTAQASDGIGFADAAVVKMTSVRQVVDQFAIATSGVVSKGPHTTDTIALGSSVTRAQFQARTTGDALAFALPFTRTTTKLRTGTSTIALATTPARTDTAVRLVTTGVAIATTPARTTSQARTSTTAVGWKTAATRTMTMVRTTADAMAFASHVSVAFLTSRASTTTLALHGSAMSATSAKNNVTGIGYSSAQVYELPPWTGEPGHIERRSFYHFVH